MSRPKPFLVALFLFGVTYLVGAFWQANLNIADWPSEARGVIAFLGSFLAASGGVAAQAARSFP